MRQRKAEVEEDKLEAPFQPATNRKLGDKPRTQE